jgi:diaminopimelate decarboxylase
MEKLEEEANVKCEVLNLGGGYPAYYTPEDAPITIKEACLAIIKACEEEKSRRRLCLKMVVIEPGRSIVAEAGYTLYRLGFQKESGGIRYAFVDGGMTDNIRPALYQAKYRCCLANRMNEPADTKVTIAGKCCESGDILIENAWLPEPETGDLLVVYSTGAYVYSMASNYNRLRRPGVVFVKDGKARLVLRPETFEDIGKLEINQEL